MFGGFVDLVPVGGGGGMTLAWFMAFLVLGDGLCVNV